MQSRIDNETIEAYWRDGAICIRQLLSTEEIQTLIKGIENNLKSLSPRAIVASPADDPGLFVEDFCNWQDNSFYKKIIFESQLSFVAAQLMKSKSSRLYHDHLLVKEPQTRQHTPWHQDQPYYNIDGTQNLSMWIPVDPVSRSSTLEFVAGSHLGPWLMPRTFLSKQSRWFADGSLAEVPDINANRDKYPILGWETQPGDVVCFHMLALHAAGPAEENRRRVFSLRFLGDDITHAPRPWATSPEFPNLAKELAPGVEMEHPLFPLLWRTEI